MANQSVAKEIRRQLMLRTSEEGTFDILAGLILLTFGFLPVLDNAGLHPGIGQVLLFGFYMLEIFGIIILKRTIVWPRTGYFELIQKHKSGIGITLLVVNIILFLGIIGFQIFAREWFSATMQYSLSLALGTLFLVMLSAVGAIFGSYRFYIYALVVPAVMIISEYLYHRDLLREHGLPFAAILSGSVMIITGLVLLLRFLKKYPVDRSFINH